MSLPPIASQSPVLSSIPRRLPTHSPKIAARAILPRILLESKKSKALRIPAQSPTSPENYFILKTLYQNCHLEFSRVISKKVPNYDVIKTSFKQHFGTLISEQHIEECYRFLLSFFTIGSKVSPDSHHVNRDKFDVEKFIFDHLNSPSLESQLNFLERMKFAHKLYCSDDVDLSGIIATLKIQFFILVCSDIRSALSQHFLSLLRENTEINGFIKQKAIDLYLRKRAPSIEVQESFSDLDPLLNKCISRCKVVLKVQQMIKAALEKSIVLKTVDLATKIYNECASFEKFQPSMSHISAEIEMCVQLSKYVHVEQISASEPKELQTIVENEINQVCQSTPIHPSSRLIGYEHYRDLIYAMFVPVFPFHEGHLIRIIDRIKKYSSEKPLIGHNLIIQLASQDEYDINLVKVVYKHWWYTKRGFEHSASDLATQWIALDVVSNSSEITKGKALELVKDEFEKTYPFLPFDPFHADTSLFKLLKLRKISK